MSETVMLVGPTDIVESCGKNPNKVKCVSRLFPPQLGAKSDIFRRLRFSESLALFSTSFHTPFQSKKVLFQINISLTFMRLYSDAKCQSEEKY